MTTKLAYIERARNPEYKKMGSVEIDKLLLKKLDASQKYGGSGLAVVADINQICIEQCLNQGDIHEAASCAEDYYDASGIELIAGKRKYI